MLYNGYMQLSSQIFIDGGDPAETSAADRILKKVGYPGVQGQTTNPSLIAKQFLQTHISAAEVAHENFDPSSKVASVGQREAGQNFAGSPPRFKETDLVGFYRQTVREMAEVTKGPISIQVLGDLNLTAEQMLTQARDRIGWIPNGVVKFPATIEGLKAAEIFCQEGPVNLTLVFSQEQAAAVYAATRAHNYEVFVSPFVGRLDDRGENGMDIVANIIEMYQKLGDNHVKVLTASVRNIKQIQYALWLKSDVITIPFKLLKEWADLGFSMAPPDFIYDVPGLTDIPYKELTLDKDWREFDISHDLTQAGVAKFWEDWKNIIE